MTGARPMKGAVAMLGHPHYHFDRLASTNDEAKRLAAGGAPEGTLVTAGFQTHGRGRNDRSWESEEGRNFLGSYILYPPAPPAEWGALSLLAGVAVRDAIAKLADRSASIKWPNDVLVGGKKIAGVLIESTIMQERSLVVVGIGLNVNQMEFEGTYRLPPTSLALVSGRPSDLEDVEEELSGSLDHWYKEWRAKGNAWIAGKWRERMEPPGAEITIDAGPEHHRGKFARVNPDGSIRLLLAGGEERDFYAGEILAPDRWTGKEASAA